MVSDRILMPAFGPAKIRGMFNSMTDIASQLLAKWEVRHVPCVPLYNLLTCYSCNAEVIS